MQTSRNIMPLASGVLLFHTLLLQDITYAQEIEVSTKPQKEVAQALDKPLNVPVYPRGNKQTLADISDFHDQYILLNDGSVISMG